MSDNITIARTIYDELIKDQKQLRRLEAAGVDNWEGYPGGEDDEESEEDIYGKVDA